MVQPIMARFSEILQGSRITWWLLDWVDPEVTMLYSEQVGWLDLLNSYPEMSCGSWGDSGYPQDQVM